MMADGSFNINTANCNTGMTKALFFANGTNTTDVTGTTLDLVRSAPACCCFSFILKKKREVFANVARITFQNAHVKTESHVT